MISFVFSTLTALLAIPFLVRLHNLGVSMAGRFLVALVVLCSLLQPYKILTERDLPFDHWPQAGISLAICVLMVLAWRACLKSSPQDYSE